MRNLPRFWQVVHPPATDHGPVLWRLAQWILFGAAIVLALTALAYAFEGLVVEALVVFGLPTIFLIAFGFAVRRARSSSAPKGF